MSMQSLEIGSLIFNNWLSSEDIESSIIPSPSLSAIRYVFSELLLSDINNSPTQLLLLIHLGV